MKQNSNIIDYATSGDRSDFLDIYLISKCEFIVSDSTGNTSMANLFRKPCLTVNEFSPHSFGHHPEKLMILPKKIKNLNTGKLISFEEAYKKKFNFIKSYSQCNELGLEVIENSEFEIKKATVSFFDLINNGFSLDETLQKQKRYWQNVEKYTGDKNKYKTIICPHFYLNNNDLF